MNYLKDLRIMNKHGVVRAILETGILQNNLLKIALPQQAIKAER